MHAINKLMYTIFMTTVIPMPSNQYYFELTNETVGRLDHTSSQVKGLVIGYTQIVVQDKSILLCGNELGTS